MGAREDGNIYFCVTLSEVPKRRISRGRVRDWSKGVSRGSKPCFLVRSQTASLNFWRVHKCDTSLVLHQKGYQKWRFCWQTWFFKGRKRWEQARMHSTKGSCIWPVTENDVFGHLLSPRDLTLNDYLIFQSFTKCSWEGSFTTTDVIFWDFVTCYDM